MLRFLLFTLVFTVIGSELLIGPPGECKWLGSGTEYICEGSTLTEIPLNFPDTTEYIKFKDTGITTIPAEVFKKYTKLIRIQFWNNSLNSIDKHAFQGSLNRLMINFGKLPDSAFGPDPFEGISSLTDVYLNYNTLTTFPLHLFMNATQLVKFQVEDNKIDNMGPALDVKLRNLKFINLRYNKLTSLNASMFNQVPNLETLYVDHNEISVIHDGNAFMEMPSLKILHLGNNPLHCDCGVLWMVKGRAAGKDWAWNQDVPKCGSPAWMVGKDIHKLYPQDLTCEPPIITPNTPILINPTTNTPLKLQAKMKLGFPSSTWIAPDGTTANDGDVLRNKFNTQYGSVKDEIIETDHSVVTTLTINERFDRTGLFNFTLIASNVVGDTNRTFWVYIEPPKTTPAPTTDVPTTDTPCRAVCGHLYSSVVIMLIYSIIVTVLLILLLVALFVTSQRRRKSTMKAETVENSKGQNDFKIPIS